jgi:hypothetical protein
VIGSNILALLSCIKQSAEKNNTRLKILLFPIGKTNHFRTQTKQDKDLHYIIKEREVYRGKESKG